jgi:hypothetical protein
MEARRRKQVFFFRFFFRHGGTQTEAGRNSEQSSKSGPKANHYLLQYLKLGYRSDFHNFLQTAEYQTELDAVALQHQAHTILLELNYYDAIVLLKLP